MTDAKRGRPSIFSGKLADEICELLADGKSLREICRDDAMPAKSTVCKWLAENPEFADQYTRAREIQAEALVEESLEIADDATNDWMLRNRDGKESWELNGENIQRSRLRVDTRRWFASKLAPKKYGDRLELGGGLSIKNAASGMTDDELAAIAAGRSAGIADAPRDPRRHH